MLQPATFSTAIVCEKILIYNKVGAAEKQDRKQPPGGEKIRDGRNGAGEGKRKKCIYAISKQEYHQTIWLAFAIILAVYHKPEKTEMKKLYSKMPRKGLPKQQESVMILDEKVSGWSFAFFRKISAPERSSQCIWMQQHAEMADISMP